MTTASPSSQSFELQGIDGTNPLGFLAAVGTLVVLHQAGHDTRLAWKQKRTWLPVLHLAIPSKTKHCLLKTSPAVLQTHWPANPSIRPSPNRQDKLKRPSTKPRQL